MPRSFALLIKPVSLDCNLRCRYCFYLPRGEYLGHGRHQMAAEMLETLMRRYAAAKMPEYQFCWQGGEPTLAGLDFYRQVLALQKRVFTRQCKISHALQTNGTLLDDDWAAFLAQNNFLTGISIDGPDEIHDLHRRTVADHGSHAQVMHGLELLKKHHAPFNVLTLVSSANVQFPELVYRHICELGVTFHQYIECVERNPAGELLPYSLKPGQWGEFLCRLFDAWYPQDVHRVSIRLFDSIISRLATGVPTLCSMCGDCRNYFVIEHDGSVYPCDFYVYPELKLGNLATDDFKSLQSRKTYVDFGRRKLPPASCNGCKWLPLCMGDCCKNRATSSLLCDDWKMFYSHTIGRFEQLASELQ